MTNGSCCEYAPQSKRCASVLRESIAAVAANCDYHRRTSDFLSGSYGLR
jgi:hypothetical protein